MLKTQQNTPPFTHAPEEHPLTTTVEIMTSCALERSLKRMAQQINERHPGPEPLTLIGINAHGSALAERLRQHLHATRPTVRVISLTALTRSGQEETITAMQGQRVILVTGLLARGHDVHHAINVVLRNTGAEKMELAALIDRCQQTLPISANYVGKAFPTRKTESVHVLLTETDGQDQVILKRAAPTPAPPPRERALAGPS